MCNSGPTSGLWQLVSVVNARNVTLSLTGPAFKGLLLRTNVGGCFVLVVYTYVCLFVR